MDHRYKSYSKFKIDQSPTSVALWKKASCYFGCVRISSMGRTTHEAKNATIGGTQILI